MGRPLTDINEKMVAKLALRGNNNCDIAAYFGVDESTIRERFPEILRKNRALRRARLRAKQYEQALKGNTTMLIWLGKQELDQADKQETKNESAITITEGGIDTSPRTD